MNPLIGITTCYRPEKTSLDSGFFLNHAYTAAIVQAGGIPVMLPAVSDSEVIEKIAAGIDGLLLSGGDGTFSIQKTGALPVLTGLRAQNPHRHVFDTAICRLALEKNMPVLGVCRGHQTLNETAGGSLVLDIRTRTSFRHYQKTPGDHVSHELILEKGSKLEQFLIHRGKPLLVNSLHRQAVDQPAPGFIVTSRSPDGIVESIESRKHTFVMGVQFHPELLEKQNSGFETIYTMFTKAAQKYRGRK